MTAVTEAAPVIDLHRHLYSVFERYESVRTIAARTGVAGHHEHTHVESETLEHRVARIREEMAQARVDRSCLLLADYGVRLGEGVTSIRDENLAALEVTAEYPDQFVPFVGIDPRRDDAAEICRESLAAGARGIKLHPGAGFSPADPVCTALYELAGEYSAPVAIHTGPTAAPLLSTFCSPLEVDRPAADFPEVDFILLHAGQRAWFPLALDLAWWKPNIHLEVSLWQTLFIESPAEFIARLGTIRAAIGLDRVLFGSDCPGVAHILSLREWVDAFRDLPGMAESFGVTITDADVEAMLGGTAQKLLDLPAPQSPSSPSRTT